MLRYRSSSRSWSALSPRRRAVISAAVGSSWERLDEPAASCLADRCGMPGGGLRGYGSQHAGLDLEGGRVVPDAAIVAAAPGGAVWMYCLELDRGTMPAVALGAKFERYRLLRRLGELRREDAVWGLRASSWILFACPDVQRAALAARLAEERGLERFWSGTGDELPQGLSDAIGPDSASAPAGAAGLPGGLALPLSEEAGE